MCLLLSAMGAEAQAPDLSQRGQPPVSSSRSGFSGTPATPVTPDVIITGKAPSERPLPALSPDEFKNCDQQIPLNADSRGDLTELYIQSAICTNQLAWETHVVVGACLNAQGDVPAPRVIQACTESLDRKIFEGKTRYVLFAARAAAYLAQGEDQSALDDYNESIRLAPRRAQLYYDRGIVYAAAAADGSALSDFNRALNFDPKLVPALRARARLYEVQGNTSGALADYSQAIRIEPKSAALWSERGYVSLREHDYAAALKDENRAIQLDPKLARAYYLRGDASGALGDRAAAISDLHSAVKLDPSLARYVSVRGKTVVLGLPPM